jgi:hypothetical protein
MTFAHRGLVLRYLLSARGLCSCRLISSADRVKSSTNGVKAPCRRTYFTHCFRVIIATSRRQLQDREEL